MKIQTYKVYLNSTESHVYTFEASSFRALACFLLGMALS
jgi:hypothetical protein